MRLCCEPMVLPALYAVISRNVVTLPLTQFVSDFAAALKAVDATKPEGSSRKRTYRPGVGPLGEDQAVSRALTILKGIKHGGYADAAPRSYPRTGQECDLVIPGERSEEHTS